MSDSIKHECGLALLRLRKPLAYYADKYGTPAYGFARTSLLMEKQHNRGQDGAGMACVGLDVPPGRPFYSMEKSCSAMPLADLLERISSQLNAYSVNHSARTTCTCDLERPFCGEVYLGHVRYGTFGTRNLDACHPMVCDSPRRDHTLLAAGNFNLTNTADVFNTLVKLGYHPRGLQDCRILLICLAHYLGECHGDLLEAVRQSAIQWDGGFVIGGVVGNGDAFAFRDAHGIRPAFYYMDDEVVALASERVALQTAFDLSSQEVTELPGGHLLQIPAHGEVTVRPCLPPAPPRHCVFERIYFSRGNDADIQQERRALGRAVVPQVLKAIDDDIEHTVFSYIPNTAQCSFHGMLDALDEHRDGRRLRFGMVAVKDAKFRTFITDGNHREELFPHVYDVTYGLVRPHEDNLVVIDDSIVRGNTMRRAILPILARLGPKRIVIVSAAPQIRYPDCYGIDMASFGELVAFQACMDLLAARGMTECFDHAVQTARQELAGPVEAMHNQAAALYGLFGEDELTEAIRQRLLPEAFPAELKLVFLPLDQLRPCIPNHTGDWYFTGDYPTPGGFRVVNQALSDYANHLSKRAY